MVPRSKYNLNNPRLMKVPRDMYQKYRDKYGENWAEEARHVLDLGTEAFE